MISHLSNAKKNIVFLASALALIAFVAFSLTNKDTQVNVVTILNQLGIVDPPAWLVWALVAAGATSVIVALLVSGGWIASIPAWAEAALLAADSYAL
ncbi:hypothetical protein QNH46_04580 [Paenibacillus woosongensis]|uniref:Uncharacterized protein n=1 Tax=Paenibacillus woosongensis TaxID=307580 RepID=A0AA95I520_9BACL|nr:hypothetical protein [Paenibacillus woosongensis]WHX49950.1 hypothetical protein QNH46_04580 [Paenibacillus woosongensis]